MGRQGREEAIRLYVAGQGHLAQLSDELRAALLANTAVQAFFRLGHADARLVASALSAGTGERVSWIAADVAKRDSEGQPEAWAEVIHTVRDDYGDALKLSAPAWTAFGKVARRGGGKAQVSALKRLARYCWTKAQKEAYQPLTVSAAECVGADDAVVLHGVQGFQGAGKLFVWGRHDVYLQARHTQPNKTFTAGGKAIGGADRLLTLRSLAEPQRTSANEKQEEISLLVTTRRLNQIILNQIIACSELPPYLQ